MLNTLITSALSATLLLTPVYGSGITVAGQAGQLVENKNILASESLDLSGRYPIASISEGFKENILVALEYLASQGEALLQGEALPFDGVYLERSRETQGKLQGGFYLTLKPGEVFAFHKKGILPEFQKDKIITQDSDFTTRTGYKVVAGLGGNGVCHLASLMNWAASEAGLEVVGLASHDFASIPGIDKKYGTSISTRNSPERQNLYIKNNFDFPVKLEFSLESDLLSLKILRGGLVY